MESSRKDSYNKREIVQGQQVRLGHEKLGPDEVGVGIDGVNRLNNAADDTSIG